MANNLEPRPSLGFEIEALGVDRASERLGHALALLHGALYEDNELHEDAAAFYSRLCYVYERLQEHHDELTEALGKAAGDDPDEQLAGRAAA